MSTSVDPYARTHLDRVPPRSQGTSDAWTSLERRVERVEVTTTRVLEVALENRGMLRATVIGVFIVVTLGILIAVLRI